MHRKWPDIVRLAYKEPFDTLAGAFGRMYEDASVLVNYHLINGMQRTRASRFDSSNSPRAFRVRIRRSIQNQSQFPTQGLFLALSIASKNPATFALVMSRNTDSGCIDGSLKDEAYNPSVESTLFMYSIGS